MFTVHLGPKKVVVLAGYKVVREALINYAEEFGERDISPLFFDFNKGHGELEQSPLLFDNQLFGQIKKSNCFFFQAFYSAMVTPGKR